MEVERNERIAYRGDAFGIEWYFDARGRSQALTYFSSLTEERQLAALMLFKRMGDSGKIFDLTKFRNEGDGLYAFKAKKDRYLSFFVGTKRIVITNAFEKKSQKLPSNEKSRALKARADYRERVKSGSYYA